MPCWLGRREQPRREKGVWGLRFWLLKKKLLLQGKVTFRVLDNDARKSDKRAASLLHTAVLCCFEPCEYCTSSYVTNFYTLARTEWRS